ncbi:hypothetical protein MC885_010013 [Smutsia gigantea]|nr:hypothetical protein MC885_010013 [Smutsia gigantea]
MRLPARSFCGAARAAWRESFPLGGRDVARWFPGHMAKEGEGIKNVIFTNCVKDENIKQVIPIVTELVGRSYRYHRGEVGGAQCWL